jgi:hypothetical protein
MLKQMEKDLFTGEGATVKHCLSAGRQVVSLTCAAKLYAAC